MEGDPPTAGSPPILYLHQTLVDRIAERAKDGALRRREDLGLLVGDWARDADGNSLWSDGERAVVERDLLLEYVIGAEPFVGGAGQAANFDNKAPRVYRAQAAVARCLGLESWRMLH